ncbi:MAG: YdiU family protein [Pseudomonadota bacterium]
MDKKFKLNFDNQFAKLPDYFYSKMLPEIVAENPTVVCFNSQAGDLIGLSSDSANDPDFPLYFSGNKILAGAEPLAQVYSGHQFGIWAGQLGDGRAILLGQIRNHKNELWDIELKGSGKTPYSRFGDGRAVLRSCIREYLCSEAMFALGIATTRSLCITLTNQSVLRETIEPGAIFTRLSPSHIRFGHFEHFAAAKNYPAIKELADHLIANYFPDHSYSQWFAKIVKDTTILISQWQAVGFCHGVMNTDNMSALGLTIDYGPFGFMENFDPHYICNHSDYHGRYAYDQQPAIALWNLQALAHSLKSLIDWQEMMEILEEFPKIFSENYKILMRKKLALNENSNQNDNLWLSLIDLIQIQKADYTLAFRYLAGDEEKWLNLFSDKNSAQIWLKNYQHFIQATDNLENIKTKLNQINPKYILRNWVAEMAIRAAEDCQDYSLIKQILKILHQPFAEHLEFEHFAKPAPQSMQNLCVSCSS